MSAATSPAGTGDAAPSPALAPPPGSPRFPLFDSLRAVAVSSVLVFHVSSLSGVINGSAFGRAALVLGNLGLVLFFVISGFLLYRPFAAAYAGGRRLPASRRYARRRLLRIVPAYWAALTVLAIFPGVAGVFTGDWWRFYGFLQLYSQRTFGQGIPPAWSLCVEVSFYVALPLWARAVRRLPRGAGAQGWLRTELCGLAAVAACGALVQFLVARRVVDGLVGQTLAGQSVWFALGMALAVWSVHDAASPSVSPLVRVVVARSGACWLGAAGALAGLMALVPAGGLFGLVVALRREQTYADTFASIALTAAFAGLMVLPAVFGGQAGGVPRRFLRLAPVAWLGMVSYAVYLYHLTVAEVLAHRQDKGHFSAGGVGLVDHLDRFVTPVLLVATLAVSCTLAALSYHLVELPFLRRKER